MKILQINTFCGKESTGRLVVDLYHMVKKEGYTCKIAYGRENIRNDVETIKIGTKREFYLHGIMARITDRQGFYSESATKKFIMEVERFNPDIIHLHNLHGYYLNLPLLFKYIGRSKKKIIWTLHDCWAFTGHCTHFEFIGCRKWKTECTDCAQKNMYPKSLFIDASKRNYQEKRKLFRMVENMTIVTPSEWLAGLVKQSFLAKYSVKVIPNGVDTKTFYPRKSIFRKKYGIENKFVILGVANVWTERKGLNDFLKLSNLLDREKEQIVLVGLNKKQLKKIPKGIIPITHTNNTEELAEIYTAADIFFNPTYEDNYPTTNLEAAACGTEVITYNAGGSAETLMHQNGIVLKKGEYRKILDIIKEKRIKEEKINLPFLDNKDKLKKYMYLYKN